MKLSIVIPAHNEEHRLPPVLEAYAQFFSGRMGEEVEIIIVANNCSDATTEVAEKAAGCYLQIKVITELNNVGKGGAVMLGAKFATGDYMGFVDADGATSPEAFDDLYSKRELADAVIASRWIKGAVVEPKQPLRRRVSSRCFNFLVTTFFGFKIHDTQCGAKILKGDVMKKILPVLGETRWAFDVDLLFQIHRMGGSIKEIPTVWRNIEGSKIRYFQSSLEMVVAIVRLRLLYSPFKFIVRFVNRIARCSR